MAKCFQGVVLVGCLMKILEEIRENRELEQILGAPIEQHLALTICNGRFKFNPAYKKGEPVKKFSPEEKKRVREIVEGIIRENQTENTEMPAIK